MDATDNTSNTSDKQQTEREAQSETAERQFEGDEPFTEHSDCIETPTEDGKTAIENTICDEPEESERQSTDTYRYCSYHIKPPQQPNKQGPSGYFISKVTSESNAAQPPPSRSVGKVFVLPKQTVPRPANETYRISLHNQSGVRAPVQAAQMHVSASHMPQTCNRFILKPFPMSASKYEPNNNVMKVRNTCQDESQTMHELETGTKGPETCSSFELSDVAITKADSKQFPINNPNDLNLVPSLATNPRQSRSQCTKDTPQWCRDIRPSLSNSVQNHVAEDFHSHLKQNSGTDILLDNDISKSDTSTIPGEKVTISNPISADEIGQNKSVSDKPSQQQECAPATDDNVAIPSKSNDDKETKTPVKKKRNRKPRVYFSPSGNNISNAASHGRAPKGSRKRKLAENTIDKQYFGALKRSFAKRTKPLSPDKDSNLIEKIIPSKIETSASHTSPNHGEVSDYKLKRKAILAASTSVASAEKLRGSHLLEKLDPNDPERKQSLAIFTTRYQMQNSNQTQSYKLSFAGSLGQVHRKETDEQSKTYNEEENLTHDKELNSKNYEMIKLPNYSNAESKAVDEGNSISLTADTKKYIEETNKHKELHSNSDLVLAKSIAPTLPTVVLQRMKGITPTETVQVSQILKQTPFIAPSDKEGKEEVCVKRDIRNVEVKDTHEKENDHSKPVENEMEKREIDKSKINKNSKATDRVSHKDNSAQANNQDKAETMRDEGLLHRLLFSDNQPTCSKENMKSYENTDKNRGFKPHLYPSSKQCTLPSHNSNKTSLDSVSNMNITQTMYLAQPIPVFYSTKGQLVPGPMPIISNTYQYKVSNRSAVDTTMPATNKHLSGVNSSHLDKGMDSEVASSSKKQFQVQLSTNFPVKDPTGILTPVSKTKEPDKTVRSASPKRKKSGENIESVSSKSKTVAELLKEKRNDHNKERNLVGQPELEFLSPVSTLLRRENNAPNKSEDKTAPCTKELTKEGNQTIIIANKDELDKDSATKLPDNRASFKPLSGSPARPVSDHLYSSPSWNKPIPLKQPLRSASYSPLATIAGMEHRYSRSLSPKEVTRTLSTETTRPISLIGNDPSKNVPTSPHVPLKIVLPSPKSPYPQAKSQSTINLPVTVQTFPGMSSTQSEDYDPAQRNEKSTEATKVETTYPGGIQGQANQSFAVRIGDKMYIIRPAIPVEPPKINSTEPLHINGSGVSSKPETKLASNVPKSTKTSKKRKSTGADVGKQTKPKQAPTHQKVMKKKIKKLLKKDKTQFEELIQSLGLEHNKEKGAKPKRKPAHKITYSCTPSPAHSNHDTNESPFPIKEECVTPDTKNTSDTDTNSPIQKARTSKVRTKSVKVMEKKAIILQIFKSSNKGSKFYMHTAKLRFTAGRGGDYHRWYNHSDYPCTLHLRNTDAIQQIDVETLRSGFYLISEMDNKKSKSPETSTVAAVLSLYPPDMSILPEESMAIAVGKIDDIEESELPIPNENENETVNKNVENIIRSILEVDTFNDIEQIEDDRYGSVKDVSMSPKCHSSKFYSPRMFDCFTQKRRIDIRRSPVVKISNIDNDSKSVSAKSSLENVEETDVTVSTKAHELKMKQNELYQECSKLREKIHTGAELFNVKSIDSSLENLEELSVTSSTIDDMTPVSQNIQAFETAETEMENNDVDRLSEELIDVVSADKASFDSDKVQEDQSGISELDKNVNCCVQKKRRGKRGTWSKRSRVVKKSDTESRRCTRSFTEKL